VAVSDTWHRRDGSRTKQYGKGKRYRVRWHEHDRFFDSKGAAERYWYKIHAEDEVRAEKKVAEATVGELVDRWLAGKQGMSKSRIDGCAAAAVRVKARWGDVPARDVTAQGVREWQAYLGSRRSGVLRVGASSIRKAMEALSGAMKIGVETGAVNANPCLDIRRPAEPKRDARFLTPAELELLADNAGPDKPMILLMGTTGLRIGEACNLRVGDVDRRRRRLWVASATAKSRKGREVGIPASVIRLLPLTGRERTEYVFTSRSGERIDEHNWRSRHFAQAVEKAVLGELHPHDLRHTAVSLAIRSGADVKVVQRVAGHSSAKLTLDTYGHLWDEGIDDVARRMEDLVGGQG
jgi:integrase